MYCPIKVDRNTIELTVYTSCYCVLDLLCVSCITFYGCRCQLTLFSISLFDKYKFWIFLLQKMKSPLFFLCFNECVCEGYTLTLVHTRARVCVCVYVCVGKSAWMCVGIKVCICGFVVARFTLLFIWWHWDHIILWRLKYFDTQSSN